MAAGAVGRANAGDLDLHNRWMQLCRLASGSLRRWVLRSPLDRLPARPPESRSPTAFGARAQPHRPADLGAPGDWDRSTSRAWRSRARRFVCLSPSRTRPSRERGISSWVRTHSTRGAWRARISKSLDKSGFAEIKGSTETTMSESGERRSMRTFFIVWAGQLVSLGVPM